MTEDEILLQAKMAVEIYTVMMGEIGQAKQKLDIPERFGWNSDALFKTSEFIVQEALEGAKAMREEGKYLDPQTEAIAYTFMGIELGLRLAEASIKHS